MVESAVYIYFWSETERASYFTKFSVICSFWSLSRFSASIYSKCHSETCSYLISKYSVAALETFKIRGFWYSTNCSTNIKSKVVLKEIEVYQDSILNRRRIEKWRRRKDSIASTPNCLTSPGINDKGLHHKQTNKHYTFAASWDVARFANVCFVRFCRFESKMLVRSCAFVSANVNHSRPVQIKAE